MKVFISWSGERSHAVGTALSIWMKDIFHDVEPWMSAHEISAGARWGQELSSVLEVSHFGVLCLTAENISAPWILFEAGALAKASTIARVVPYLFGLSPGSIEFPLAQFQGVQADEEGTRQLLKSINRIREKPLEDERLRGLFARWWPELETTLKAIPPFAGVTPPKRPERELLEEILELIRQRQPEPGISPALPRPGNLPSLSRTDSTRVSHSGLSKAEEYAVTKLREGASLPDVVAGLERRGVRKRLAEDMAKQLQREVSR